jgi:signal transduction histidine kinase
VVLAADSAVPDRGATLAERFIRQTGARLEFLAPGEPPPPSRVQDVFDFTLPRGESQDTLFSVVPIPPAQGTVKLDILAGGTRFTTVLVTAALALLIVCSASLARWLGIVGLSALFVLTPAGNDLDLGFLFSEATYYLAPFAPLTASAGSLLLLAAVLMLALVLLARRGLVRRTPLLLAAGVLLVAQPHVMAFLAGGISPPATGVGVGLWLTWVGLLSLCGAVLLVATAVLIRGSGRDPRAPRLASMGAGVWALGAAVLGLYLWQPNVGWPTWYAFLWLPALVLAALPAPTTRMVVTAAVIAGAGATLLAWGKVVQGPLVLAERDATRASESDPFARGLLDDFGSELLAGEAPKTAAELYAAWRRSPLGREDYPAILTTWSPAEGVSARLDLARLPISTGLLEALAASASDTTGAVETQVMASPAALQVLSVPFPDGSVTSIAVGPLTRLIEPVRLGRFLRGERRLYAPYEMTRGEALADVDAPADIIWHRDGWVVRGEGLLRHTGSGQAVYHLHLEVPLGGVGGTLVRGALLLFVSVLLVGLAWLAGEALSGDVKIPRVVKDLIQLRSYRLRLTIALAAFFILPTLGSAVWSIVRLRADAERRGDLLIQQTLSDAAGTARGFAGLDGYDLAQQLSGLADALNADLLWYADGVLLQSNPTVLTELGLVDRYLPASVYREVVRGDGLEVTSQVLVGGQPTRVGYLSLGGQGAPVLATPRLVDVRDIRTEQEDLLYGVLLATLIGLLAAALLAAVAARSLATPVRSLRVAAAAVGRRERIPPFGPRIPAEFVSVVDAFERMARDVELSQSALETARRRTAAVLKNVGAGVVALDKHLKVTIANPRAAELLGAPLPAGAHVYAIGGAPWSPVWGWVRKFLEQPGESEVSEFTIGGKHIRAQVTAIHGSPGGVVLSLDDTTELARAVRVIAWGELARQVAHEIKNPLTPIRLGVQHLQRAYGAPRGEFEPILQRTSRQILAEIERLDAIARAFARFGSPPAEAAPLGDADLVGIARETAELYSLSEGTRVDVHAEGLVVARVRRDEVKEVLVNLIENARDAGAATVTIAVSADGNSKATMIVSDDGQGIRVEDLPLVFEPQFSTTTSGTGLGLAICKRLVESWGGTIHVVSRGDRGTEVRIEISPEHGER